MVNYLRYFWDIMLLYVTAVSSSYRERLFHDRYTVGWTLFFIVSLRFSVFQWKATLSYFIVWANQFISIWTKHHFQVLSFLLLLLFLIIIYIIILICKVLEDLFHCSLANRILADKVQRLFALLDQPEKLTNRFIWMRLIQL